MEQCVPAAASKGGSVVRGVYHLFVGNIASTILLAVTAIYVGRTLGPSAYGLYALALVAPGYLYVATQLGLQSAATRYAAKYSEEGEGKKAVSFIYSLLLFQMLLTLAGMGLVILSSGFVANELLDRPELEAVIPLAVASTLGQNLFLTASAGFQGLNRMDSSAWLQVAEAAIKLVVSAILLLTGYAVAGAVAGNTVAFIVAGVLGLAMVIRWNGSPLPHGWAQDLRIALPYAAPIYVSALVAGFVPLLQSTLMALFLKNSQIGGYGAAVNISALMSLFAYPITTALFPLFSRIGNDEIKLKETYLSTLRYTTILMVPLTMATMALSLPLTAAVYGRSYHFAGPYLAGVVAPYLLAGLGSLAWGSLLYGTGETKKALVSGVAGSLVAVVLSASLIPLWGVIGAIVASFAGQAASLAVAARYGRALLRLGPTSRGLWRTYLSSAIAAVVAYPVTYVPVHPIFVTLLGAVVFLAALVPMMVLTGSITRSDVDTLDGYFARVKPFYYPFKALEVYYGLFERLLRR